MILGMLRVIVYGGLIGVALVQAYVSGMGAL
jgi:hypothetical protein